MIINVVWFKSVLLLFVVIVLVLSVLLYFLLKSLSIFYESILSPLLAYELLTLSWLLYWFLLGLIVHSFNLSQSVLSSKTPAVDKQYFLR